MEQDIKPNKLRLMSNTNARSRHLSSLIDEFEPSSNPLSCIRREFRNRNGNKRRLLMIPYKVVGYAFNKDMGSNSILKFMSMYEVTKIVPTDERLYDIYSKKEYVGLSLYEICDIYFCRVYVCLADYCTGTIQEHLQSGKYKLRRLADLGSNKFH